MTITLPCWRANCPRPRALAWKIDRLLDDPERLGALRANARRLARLHAARAIAETLLGAEGLGARVNQ